MTKIRIAGLDGSKTNFGAAKFELDISTMKLDLVDLALYKTSKAKDKQVRASSDNLRRAREIAVPLKAFLSDCAAVFGEVPSGGQDYNSVMGFGIVIGIYASLDKNLIEVSPAETKLASVGCRTADKDDIMEWAFSLYPNAPWRTRKLRGKTVPTKDNEHLADGAAIVHAGIKLPYFESALNMMRAHAQTSV